MYGTAARGQSKFRLLHEPLGDDILHMSDMRCIDETRMQEIHKQLTPTDNNEEPGLGPSLCACCDAWHLYHW